MLRFSFCYIDFAYNFFPCKRDLLLNEPKSRKMYRFYDYYYVHSDFRSHFESHDFRRWLCCLNAWGHWLPFINDWSINNHRRLIDRSCHLKAFFPAQAQTMESYAQRRKKKQQNIELSRKTKSASIIGKTWSHRIELSNDESALSYCDEKNDCMTLSGMAGGIVEHNNDNNGSNGNRQFWCITFAGNFPIWFFRSSGGKNLCQNNKANMVYLKLFTKWPNTFTRWTMKWIWAIKNDHKVQ